MCTEANDDTVDESFYQPMNWPHAFTLIACTLIVCVTLIVLAWFGFGCPGLRR